MLKVLVVGAGFAGSVIARELADSGRFSVEVIDRRNHIAGNAYDPRHPTTGERYHQYGPHIFHTNSSDIVQYLSRFTDWQDYQHRVEVLLPSGLTAPMPINVDTLNRYFGLELCGEDEVRTLLASKSESIANPANAQEHLYSLYGRELTDQFFGRYTLKMWGLELSEMPVSVVARLPVRFDNNPYYFSDRYQLMPVDGYASMFEEMLAHENIRVRLEVPFESSMESGYQHVFNSMPIDEYFGSEFGPLPYRSIKFEHRFNERFGHEVPTVNFSDTGNYTRKTCWALYPGCGGQPGDHVTYEIPCSYEENNYERYYPIKTVDGWPQRRYKQYDALAKEKENMTFIGRCGQYVYYDMHQVVANSLTIAERFLESNL